MPQYRQKLAGAALIRIGCRVLVGRREQASADVILTKGKVITVDDGFTVAQALAIKGERIVGVGSNQQIAQMAGPATRRIDLRGRSVVPGLIDNHMHLLRAGTTWAKEGRLDGVESRKQASAMFAERAKSIT